MQAELNEQSLEIAKRWCATRGPDWRLVEEVGRGGTAPVYSVRSHEAEYALKIYDAEFSAAEKGRVEESRVKQQVNLGRHSCASLVQVYDGGRFEGRLYVLMNRAPGRELEKVLSEVPRDKIRSIVDQVARAVAFLRSHKLCHRDIKSANVFVSDDFTRATLLDLSVARDIYDPMGLGTDHDGQLPVVATARYSPPEYLFRLLEPGEQLWHALDVYQLGALLYDLIARQPLFQSEYLASKENRYRFAWIVATIEPQLRATDVDQDLVFLAKRALDKNWTRRSVLCLQDFFEDTAVQRVRAMQILGLGTAARSVPSGARAPGHDHARLNSLAAAVEDRVLEHLATLGVTARHSRGWGHSDSSREIWFAWRGRGDSPTDYPTDTEFRVRVKLATGPQGGVIEVVALLTNLTALGRPSVQMDLPPVTDSEEAAARLAELCETALPDLALLATRSTNAGG